jgi:hypothetical protein
MENRKNDKENNNNNKNDSKRNEKPPTKLNNTINKQKTNKSIQRKENEHKITAGKKKTFLRPSEILQRNLKRCRKEKLTVKIYK